MYPISGIQVSLGRKKYLAGALPPRVFGDPILIFSNMCILLRSVYSNRFSYDLSNGP